MKFPLCPPVKPVESRLTFIKYIHRPSYVTAQKRWCLCRCECGSIHSLTVAKFTNGFTKSCGCLKKDGIPRKHGMTGTKEWRAWVNMIARCYDNNRPHWDDYGGRGISVAESWRKSFQAFYDYIGPAPDNSRECSIGRIDNNGNYEPGNVRWEHRLEQNRNTRRNMRYSWNGKSLTAREWSDISGLKLSTIVSRINKYHYTIHDALTKPLYRR